MSTTPAQQAIVDRLVDAAVEYFPGLTREDVYGKRRYPPATACRAAVAYTLYKSNWTLKEVGEAFGRDHTTIHHLIMQHERGKYADVTMPRDPRDVSPPRDLNALVARVLELESQVATLEARLATVERSFIRRAS